MRGHRALRARALGRNAGLSVVEIVLVASILGLLARALIEATTSMSRVTSSGNVESLLQERGERALRTIVQDLRRSGYLADVGAGGLRAYPYTFDAGVADDPLYAHHDHAPAMKEADPGDPDFGPDREIVILLPSDFDDDERPDLDLDLNGVPELDGNGDGVRSEDASDTVDFVPDQATIRPDTGLIWSHDEISYVLVTRPDGENYLERRVNGAAAGARRLCRGVERVVFDHDEDDFSLPQGSVRVRLFLRERNENGTVHRRTLESTVRLRNGSDLGAAH